MNRTYIKTDIIDLPITFSLCQFNIQSFEILITNISKGNQKYISLDNLFLIGPCKSNQYRCLTNNQDQWCIDENFIVMVIIHVHKEWMKMDVQV